MQKVPFLDIKLENDSIRDELLEVIADAIDASDFVLGPRLSSFEHAFAEYCGCEHAIGVSSGTDAIFLILKALGVRPGDEVITPPNVFIAAVEAIARTGARPVLVDVLEDTYNLDPAALVKAVSKHTRAIIPIHLFGQTCDMDAILDVAEAHGVAVIEDACQAHGALYKGKRAGSIGRAAAFSFYPTKNLAAIGDAGAVTTNDSELADRIRSLRHHAQREKNIHDDVGYNSRMDSVQAAVLEVKLRHLEAWNETRRSLAGRIRSQVRGGMFSFQRILEDTVPSYHILAARVLHRAMVHDQLDRAGIGWGRHIAMPIHLQPGYRFLGYKAGDFPVSERLSDELLSLPIYPGLKPEQADYVAQTLEKIVVSV